MLHDLCYISLNANRDDCDKWFNHNLKQICSMKKATRSLCIVGASTVHKAVRRFGGRYFDRGQEWARVNCISASTTSPKGIIIEDGSGSESGEFSGSGSRIAPVVPEIITGISGIDY